MKKADSDTWTAEQLRDYLKGEKKPASRKRGNVQKDANEHLVFFTFLESEGINKPVTEYRFHPVREWRFDFAWPDKMIALEIEGGAWIQGRHTRGKGFIEDTFKYNAAQQLGWKVYRIIPDQLCTQYVINLVSTIA